MKFERALSLAERFPHDFTLQYPPRREYFQARFRASSDPQELAQRIGASPELLLYVHVPFCAAKCSYCNFAVDLRAGGNVHRTYVDALGKQLQALEPLLGDDVHIPGIDIGGGTPTILDAGLLKQLIQWLEPFRRRSNHDRPVSIETTPAIAAIFPDRLKVIADGGVDRISMGLQSTSTSMLEFINRRDQAGQQILAVRNLVQAGFERVNVDLIFGLPGQSLAQWAEDLTQALDLPVTSMTIYDCLYRGKGRALTRRQLTWPGPEQYGTMYDFAHEKLCAAGFHAPYGSLNFSRLPDETGTSPYFESRLCNACPYIGIGNYASSMLGDRWWFAPYHVDDWVKRVERGELLPQGDCYLLPLDERLAKQVLLSLSFGEIRARRLDSVIGPEWRALLDPALSVAVSAGWLYPTPKGWAVVPGSFGNMPKLRSLFYSTEAISWLDRLNRSAPSFAGVR